MEKAFAKKLGSDAAELLYPIVAWEEVQLLLERAWPGKGQPKEWEAIRVDVYAGWLEAAERIDRERNPPSGR
jgi:hypothetical protein